MALILTLTLTSALILTLTSTQNLILTLALSLALTSALRLRFHPAGPPPVALHIHPDIAFNPRRKYIHRGSRLNFTTSDSDSIQSFWSRTRRPPRNTDRGVNRDVLAHLARSANSSIKHRSSNVNFGLLNVRSLTGKGHLIQDVLRDCKLDFLCLTETWQHPNDFVSLNESTPSEFVYIYQPRNSGRGGGLAIIHRKHWKVLPVSAPLFHSFEYTAVHLPGSAPTILCTVYRPPKPNKDFLYDFAALLTHLSVLSPNMIIVGDFNIHMDNGNNLLSRDFTSCLDSFGLQQYINFPTHSKGHILDLVCCSGVTPTHCKADLFSLSDHKLISFNVNIIASKICVPRVITFRKINDIDPVIFSSAISDLPFVHSLSTLDELISHYNVNLQNLLNAFAPLKHRSVSFARSAPWFTSNLRLLKAKGRQLERLFRKTGLTIHREMYDNHILYYKDCIVSAKSAYYSGLVSSNEGSSKSLFSLFASLTKPPDPFPSHMHSPDFCNSLLSFFSDKISNIHQQLSSVRALYTEADSLFSSLSVCHSFSTFTLPSLSDVINIIHKSNSSTCQLDPLPTKLVKACLPTLAPLITTIICSSLNNGTVPLSLKTASVTPILKKPGLDPNNFDNLRPISNLPFLAKILEKVVASQLHSYLSTHNLYEQFQSGFRPH
uniref:Endonuclease/exonuclease/phosphatase domain-containing protein n=1 Tax=Pygocentrus nattereri TaxID=42514 RepID=A0AAR2LBI4_PYGNA